MQESSKSLRELAAFMTPFPQKMVNLAVAEKIPLEKLSNLQNELKIMRQTLGDSGRAVVRYSGTEKRLRILCETEAPDDLDIWIKRLESAVKEDMGL